MVNTCKIFLIYHGQHYQRQENKQEVREKNVLFNAERLLTTAIGHLQSKHSLHE